MTERDEAYLLRGKIQMDDAYLGGELSAGRAGRGSENKMSTDIQNCTTSDTEK
jgi:hypothetical protein